MVFDYIHFYCNQNTYLDSPAWYRKAPRVIRNTIRAFAPDGLFFVVLTRNKKGRYPYAVNTNARIFHYGYLKSEQQMREKLMQVNHYWDKKPHEITYGDIDPIIVKRFTGSHPSVMREWFPKTPPELILNPHYKLSGRDVRQRMKMLAERAFGIDLSGKHFRLIE
jgi:hypothetical protein